MVTHPPFGAKGVVSFSIKVKVVVQRLCCWLDRDGVLAGLFPCGTYSTFEAPALQVGLMRVPGPRALATRRGICRQGASRLGLGGLFETFADG